jgi:ABC-2 type transport system permease protein
MTAVNGLDFVQIVVMFVIYFLGGYLLYASLFAAIGSAVDNETDTQQFSMPIMLPIIFAIYAGIFSAENPDGPLAFWCSMIPFTSPIVMMVRLPFDVPFWQIALSVGILILSFVGTTWMAGKIYRTGILMYGKKVTWKEMWKWLKY